MGKLLAIILMLLASVGGGAYYVSNQNKPAEVKPVSSGSAVINKTSPTPSSTVLSTTDASIDSDITALDKDLAGLEQSDTTLTNDINGL